MVVPQMKNLLPDLWAGAIGAALRGSLIPRESDDLISLLPEGTEVSYQTKRLNSFASLCGKIITFTLVGVLMVFGAVWGVAVRQYKNYQATLQSLINLPEVVEVKSLQAEARAFNEQLARLVQADQKIVRWSKVLDPIINAAAQEQITIQRLSLSEGAKEIRLSGIAPTEKRALDFSLALEKYSTLFSQVKLPLSSLSPVSGGFSFEITIVINELPRQ